MLLLDSPKFMIPEKRDQEKDHTVYLLYPCTAKDGSLGKTQYFLSVTDPCPLLGAQTSITRKDNSKTKFLRSLKHFVLLSSFSLSPKYLFEFHPSELKPL